MKKIILISAAILFATNLAFGQGTAINDNGAAADNSAILDVSSTTQGILVPRMTSAQRAGISSPATGLMVYQTDIPDGFWYYDGAVWIQAIGPMGVTGQTGVAGATGITGPTGADGGGSGWGITGNTGINSGTNFLGTLNNASLKFRTNSSQKMLIDSTGKVGIGLSNPSAMLNVYGSSGNIFQVENPSWTLFQIPGTLSASINSYQKFYIRPWYGPDASYGALYVDNNTSTASSPIARFKYDNDAFLIYGDHIQAKGNAFIEGSAGIGSSSQFQVNSSGNITKINNVAYSFPSLQGGTSTVLQNDGSGNLSWVAPAGGGVGPMDGWWTIVTDFTNGWVTADGTGNSGSSRGWASLEAQSGNIANGKIRLQNSNFSNVANMGALWCDWTKTYDIEWVAQMVQNTANGKAWFMMTSSTTAGNDPGTGAIGFRIDGTAIKGLAYGGGTLTITDLGTTLVDSPRRLRVVYTPSASVKFYVDGVLKATQTTNLPSGGEEKMIVSTTNGTDAAQNRPAVSRIYWYRAW